jgi:flavin reductase (DIM6/NTAB) family NADH-FMN oxidoreductase RutF
MTKKELKPQPLVLPHPTVLVGAMVDGRADFAAVAWTGVASSDPAAVSIAVQPPRHSLKGIYQNRTFSVNIPSVNLVKEADYCGLVSGRDEDKVKECKFKVFYGKIPTAPLIKQCPVNLECEVAHILTLGMHTLVVGKVAGVYVDEDCLTEGHPDIEKIKPFIFGYRKYYELGGPIADAFKCGWAIKPKNKPGNKR